MKVQVKRKFKVGFKLNKNYKYVDGYEIEPSNINDVVIVRKYGDNVLKVQHINSYPNSQKIRYDPKRDVKRPSVMIDGWEYWEDEIVIFPNGRGRKSYNFVYRYQISQALFQFLAHSTILPFHEHHLL